MGPDSSLRLFFSRTNDASIWECESDLLVFAIGQNKNLNYHASFPGIELDENGCIKVDKNTLRTGHPHVWAGGDCVNGGKEVVFAVTDAKIAASRMHSYLMNNDPGEEIA